ncbi:MAG: hypothetical protein ACJAX5_001968 [Patiriisocius sp.]|jgi:hypothetical protein
MTHEAGLKLVRALISGDEKEFDRFFEPERIPLWIPPDTAPETAVHLLSNETRNKPPARLPYKGRTLKGGTDSIRRKK